MPRQRQAEAHTADEAGVHVVSLPEPLKQERQRLGADADSRVGHRHRNRIVLDRKRGVDNTTARGELDAVRQQVPEDLLHPIGITVHHHRPVGDRAPQRDPFGVGRRPHAIDRRAQRRRDVARLERQPDLPGDDAGDVEDVRDELRDDACVPLDDLDHLLAPLVRIAAIAEHPRVAEDGVERRPQFVGKHRQELVFRPSRFLRPPGEAALLGDIARDLRCPDDGAVAGAHGRYAERDVDERAVLPLADGLKVFDRPAGANGRQHLVLFGLTVGWNDETNRTPDNLVRGVAEHPFRRRVPGLHDPVQILADNGVLGRVHNRREPYGFLLEHRLLGHVADDA